jgi:hypothetical protein
MAAALSPRASERRPVDDVDRLDSIGEYIFAAAVQTVLAQLSLAPTSVVVGGSFGRKEETILLPDGHARVLGDANAQIQRAGLVLQRRAGSIHYQELCPGVEAIDCLPACNSRIRCIPPDDDVASLK